MKNRFNTLDLRAIIAELQERFQGMRVINVYDIDSKTYLVKLAKPDQKAMILLESGIRLHSTDFEWPKNITPSSFSMKLRKHLRTQRLEKVSQLGIDRIVDLQFGSSEAAYHIILELYDRGNIVLTDHEYTILNILRPRTDQSEDVRFAVHEKYPVDSVKKHDGLLSHEVLMNILLSAKDGDNLKKTLNPKLAYGPALIEHCLLVAGIPNNARIGNEFNVTEDMPKLMAALEQAEAMLESSASLRKGYIIQKKEKKAVIKGEEVAQELLTYFEFHPFLFRQHESYNHIELESFDKAVDEFYSKIGSQKLDMKTLQQERAALKKLDHIKSDHEKRLHGLQREQESDMNKARLIEMNLDLVDRAILIVRSAIANQIDWDEIHTIVKEAQSRGDPVASSIKTLKLDTNNITMFLRDPYLDSDEEADSEDHEAVIPMKIDVDLELTAYANARKYYDKKRKAATKEQKTVDASSKALKSAEKKTYQALKEVQTVATISKARKTYWFEKFLWFISSENYIVIGGRDQQQNEHIFKKYLKPGDLYVHADLHGASSVIIKNPSGEPVPPKTLNEAGTMALCNSAAWDAKVVTSAWWVYHHQVTKTAPTGEYLSTGSFMIRGKKNFLPPSYLIYGFGFLFKLDEDSVFRHRGERRVKMLDDDMSSVTSSSVADLTEDVELTSKDGDDDDDDDSVDENEENESQEAQVKAETVDADIKAEKNINMNAADETQEGQEANYVSDEEKEEEGDAVEATTKEDQDEEEEEETLFPDTNIDVQYVTGEKLRVQASRTTSTRTTSTGSGGNLDDAATDSDTSSATGVNRGRRLSAKERREMKKKRKQLRTDGHLSEEMSGDSASRDASLDSGPQSSRKKQQKQQQQQQQQQQTQQHPKRGQKAKMKKMKEKYKDQDEDERRLRMEILASAGPQKEPKKKAKKGKQQQQGKPQGQRSQQGQKPPTGKGHPGRPLTIDDIKAETSTLAAGDSVAMAPVAKEEDALSDEEKQALMEEENILFGQDTNELDSLTGLPIAEDILHFCVPVCGPYSALLNYKYKVKLTPGSTKRGKAAKTALHAFTHDRSTTSREKDLFKSLKEVDLSRNIPGKVKVSAPNLLKQKKK